MRRPRALKRAIKVIRARPRRMVAIAAAVFLVGAALGWYVVVNRRVALVTSDHSGTWRVSERPVRPTRVVTFAEGCTTSQCHSEITSAPVLHEPFSQSACNACHGSDTGGHVYPLLRSKEATCSACHNTGGNDRFQHKAMSDEACLACHNPHSGTTRALLSSGSTEATCARCHPSTEGRTSHKPYAAGRCVECHDPHGADNRHLLLGGEGADHCRQCHAPIVQKMETAKHSHRSVEGSCSACHAPHAAERSGLLHAQPRDLCITCHADIGAAVSGARVSHDPVLKDQQCITCHDPHASENPKMLRHTESAVCLSCHGKEVIATDGRKIAPLAASLASAPVVHGAVALGDCSACHSVHGGTHERLLKEVNQNVLPGPFDIRNYALCFACHDKDLAGVGATTLFRDGERNLHEVHLNSKDKSRGCAACHAVHSSDLPRLIAKTVNYEGSKWAIPTGFVITPEGGSCSPGCHEPMGYSRRAGGFRALQKEGKR